ncbi:MAG: 16S rRNA (uracil(1498)-N(3))-methyltransferase [Planctomycetes bacterium]|nr:16S rRNA (uracil(1498)-N(3))-methyltransferase [Planctomycetota bacterium]
MISESDGHYLFKADRTEADRVYLDESETRHLRSVLRVQEGDTAFVTLGQGHIYRVEIESFQDGGCVGKVREKQTPRAVEPEMDFYVGLPDKTRFDQMLELLVPLGIRSVTPVECKYCQKKWWTKRWGKKEERFQRKIVASAKQSWNARFPRLSSPLSFEVSLERASGELLLADPEGTKIEDVELRSGTTNSYSCFVGPPGGFSPDEKEALETNGAVKIWISPFRLRTELAAAILAGLLVSRFG